VFLVPLKLFAFSRRDRWSGTALPLASSGSGRAVSDSVSMRSSSDKGHMVSAGIGSATGLRLAPSTRHSNAVRSWPDRLTSHIRSGVGRARLRHAIAEARQRGAGRLTILADPNAAERAGAVRIGEAPSDALPGRLLPRYEVRLDSTGDRDLEAHLGGRSRR